MFAQKPFENGQAARAVVGQLTFTKGDQNSTGQVLGGAGGIAWANNRLYVADSNRLGALPNNSRVLVFDTTLIPGPYADITADQAVQTLTSCYVCGSPAIISLGQNTYTPPTYTPSGQNTPVTAFYNGINGGQDLSGSNPAENAWLYNATAVGSDGVHFAVADTDNNRILLWNTIPNGNTHPDLVLGQVDFNHVQAQQLGVVSRTGLRGPQGVWLGNGKVYVADTQNYRVLIWNSWPTTNNQPPDVVLGQPDFTHANAPPPTTTAPTAAANQLLNPVGVTADAGHVFVADLGFNRVLIWNTTSPTIDQNADVVIGQPDFTQTTANNVNVCYTVPHGTTAWPLGTQGQCQSSLNYPRFALSDGTRLFIADGGNDRVLIFNHIPTVNGVSADGVLGQTNFTNDIVTSVSISIVSTEVDNTGGVDTTPTPTSLAWDGTNLYVADPYNRRILMFTAGDSILPSGFNQAKATVPVVNWGSGIVRQEGTVTFSVTAGGKITGGDTTTVTIQGVAYTYTEKGTDTLDIIAKSLVALINKSDQNVTATFAGAGSGTLYLSSLQKSGAEAVSLQYDTITLAATTSNTANLTAIASGAYLSAGNAATTSPGTLIEVDAPAGVTFTDVDTPYVAPLNSATNNGQVPATVNGVQLYLDGFASPLYKVSPTQLVGQIPYTYGDRNSTSVYVRTVHNNGTITVTNATPVYIAPANPGIFSSPYFPQQSRPWPISQARHQVRNPSAVISFDGSATVGDTLTVYVNVNTAYTYTVQTGDTLETIVNQFVTLMQNDPLVIPSNGGSFTRLVLTARSDGFNGGNGIPVSTGTGTTKAGTTLSCSTTTTSATETLTPYNSTGNDTNCRPTVNTCCAVQNGSLIYPDNPAVPGELISIAVAGMGGIQDQNANDITNSIATGFPYSGPAPPNNDVLSPNFAAATMGGVSAQVIFAGLEEGSYGIYRADILVPSSLTANNQTPLYIAQNAFISNTVHVPVGNAVANPPGPPPVVPPSPINMSIDLPAAPLFGSVTQIGGTVLVAGWATDTASPVTSVAIQIDGVTVGTATYGISRPDVCANYPTVLSCPNVGYNYNLDTTNLANGSHTLEILVTDAAGRHATNPVGTAIYVVNDPNASNTRVDIDTPATAQVYHGAVNFVGWAINYISPIVSFTAYLDGIPVDPSQIQYGLSRPDVCVAASSPNCPNVGWSYLADLTRLPNSNTVGGTTIPHTFTIEATAANGQKFTNASTFFVSNYNALDLYVGPTITIDSPTTAMLSSTLSGTVPLQGWAIDANAVINYVAYSIDGVPLGNLNYGASRTDVCAALANIVNVPGCPSVGFTGSLDTTAIADGSHLLGFTAYPLLGQPQTRTVAVNIGNVNSKANPLLIAIDSPSSAVSSYSGAANVAGWTITNSSSTAAIQSVEIEVDGVPVGTAHYGVNRQDVCAVFPGRPGCPNVGFSYSLDTTRLSNGSHFLDVISYTTDGKRAGAATQFTVHNTATNANAMIDSPTASGLPYSGLVTASGWAVNTNFAITSVTVSIDGIPSGAATYGTPRPDVCAALPNRPLCPNVGWTYMFDTSPLIDGVHVISITANAADGSANTVESSFTVSNWTLAQPLSANIDAPTSAELFYTGKVTFYGWMLNPNLNIRQVAVTIDGVPFGNAPKVSRGDVCASFTSPDCPNVGWSILIDTSLLTNAQHSLAVTGITNTGQNITLTQSFTSEN